MSRSTATSTASYTDGDNAMVDRDRHDEEHRLRVRAGAPHRGRSRRSGSCSRGTSLDSPQVASATVAIREHAGADPDRRRPGAPTRSCGSATATRTASVGRDRVGRRRSRPGSTDLTVMKTGEVRVRRASRATRYTTLRETDDRIMATKVSATWRYGGSTPTGTPVYDGVSRTLLDVLADHHSPSVQALDLDRSGRAMLERHAEIDEVRMSLPNLHHWIVDLTPVRRRQPGRDLRGDDGAARAHRGDRPPRVAGADEPAHAAGRRGRRRAACPGVDAHPDARRAGVPRRPAAPVRARARGAAPPPGRAPRADLRRRAPGLPGRDRRRPRRRLARRPGARRPRRPPGRDHRARRDRR